MLRDRILRGLIAGAIAAAATAGALLGLGRARGETFTLLNDAAHVVIGERARIVENANLVVTGVAMLIHLASLLAWGVVFVVVAGSLRGWQLLLAALVFSGVVYAVDLLLLPESLRPGFETAMSAGELALLYVILAAALWLGAREAEGHATRLA